MSLKSWTSSTSQYILVSWPEQDSYSIISARKIVSNHDKLEVGAICNVKNYEHCLTKVLAMGTEHEMDYKLMQIIEDDRSSEEVPTLVKAEKKDSHHSSQGSSNSSCSKDKQCDETGQEIPPDSPLLPPEPDFKWYVHPITPHQNKIKRIHSSHKKTKIDPAPREEKEDEKLTVLMNMVKELKVNMDKMLERMDRLELAVSQCSTRDLPPPLPPRNTPKQHTTPNQQHLLVTHQVSPVIPPGYLVPLKLTDM